VILGAKDEVVDASATEMFLKTRFSTEKNVQVNWY